MVRVGDTQQGKIYKLVSHETDMCYIGSTSSKYLSVRFGDHKKMYKRWINGKMGRRTSFELFKYDDCKIILLEEYPCNSKYELEARERYYIENEPNCVNKQHPDRTRKEYRADNYDYLKIKAKEWQDNNREAILAKHKQYYKENKDKWLCKVKCECGAEINAGSMSKHLNSNKHQKYLIPE